MAEGKHRLYRHMIATELGTTDRHIGDHRLEEFRDRAKFLSNRLSTLLEDGGWSHTSKELFMATVGAAASRKYFLTDEDLEKFAANSKRIAARKKFIFDDE
ncbi:hypothetical protein [Coleofasciculus sp.]|uniref:hypothetical protein n=1 Tax=Coleofasciculus sp. TaxID=3100458 RepID=UPI0039F75F63